jgi:transcriptional regulator with XRE-family HTH domain
MRNMRNAQNVLRELERFGMNQKELAEELGVNRDTISNWWGGTSPSRKNWFILNQLLDELKAKEKAIAERKPPSQKNVNYALDRMMDSIGQPDWMDDETYEMVVDCYWSHRWSINYYKNDNRFRPIEELRRWETSKLWEDENLMITLVANFHPSETLREHFSMLTT